MPISGWMDKEDVVGIHNEILLSQEKGRYSPICDNTDGLWGHAEWGKSDREKQVLCIISMWNLKKLNL